MLFVLIDLYSCIYEVIWYMYVIETKYQRKNILIYFIGIIYQFPKQLITK